MYLKLIEALRFMLDTDAISMKDAPRIAPWPIESLHSYRPIKSSGMVIEAEELSFKMKLIDFSNAVFLGASAAERLLYCK